MSSEEREKLEKVITTIGITMVVAFVISLIWLVWIPSWFIAKCTATEMIIFIVCVALTKE